MTLRNLQIFLAVAETGSMVKAAKQLYMTQPSISQVISDLEKAYNVTLFERKNRKLQLTQTGEKLVEYAKRTILCAKETEDFLNFESSHPQISAGATPTIGACIMSSVIEKLHETIPNLVHHVRVDDSECIVSEIVAGNIDIALVEGEINHPDIESRPVIRDRIVLVCSREHHLCSRISIDISELAGESLIVREKGCTLRNRITDEMEKRGLEPNVCWACSDYDSIIEAAKKNLGVAVITERYSRKERVRKNLHIMDITGIDSSYNYQLAFRKGRLFPESLMEFIRVCEEFGALNDVLAKSE